MGALFGVCGFFGIIVSLVIICIKAIKKQSKRNSAISLAICFILLILGVKLTSSNDEKEKNIQAAVSTEEAIDRSIPDEDSEDVTEEITTEIPTEQRTIATTETTTETLTEQKAAFVETEELPVVDTEKTTTEALTETVEAVTEDISQTTTEATTEEIITEESAIEEVIEKDYVLNTNTRKFHKPSCKSVKQMKDKNKEEYRGTRDDVINMGYEPCKNCNPQMD